MTSLERGVQLHEDVERLELEAAEHLLLDTKSQLKRVLHQHAAARAIDRALEASQQLAAVLQDDHTFSDLARGTGQEAMNQFYDRLREVRDYHRRFPDVMATQAGRRDDDEELRRRVAEDALPQVSFSGPENNGRHLDLHEFYSTFLNLAFARLTVPPGSLSYRQYLLHFFEFSSKYDSSKDEEYAQYLRDLLAYLVDFLRRSQPLLDVRRTLATTELEIETQWNNGSFRSWPDGNGASAAAPAGDPLFCVACNKRFAKQTVFDGHVNGKAHRAAAQKMQGRSQSIHKDVFALEVKINRLANTISDVIQATVSEIDKKQSRTLREQLEAMDQESEEDLIEDEEQEQEEEEQGFVRQIKNYPVGWDGEPIPYWLYRLHGLGVEYKCEICGNTSYWGRRAFEKHFEESRHQGGLKLLGLTYSASLFEIVKIKDAVELSKKLQQDEKAKTWNPDEEVEMEDENGRVYDRKTYELLRKQGIIRK